MTNHTVQRFFGFFPTLHLSLSLVTTEQGICPADHGGAHAECFACLSSPFQVCLRALNKNRHWEFLPPVSSCCSLLARTAPPVLSFHQPPPVGRFHIGSNLGSQRVPGAVLARVRREASVLWVWNGDHWNLSGRSSWSYSPVAQTGVGLFWERVQVERGGRRLEPQSAPLPLARLAPVSKGATSSYS